jgi:hypothetical protein
MVARLGLLLLVSACRFDANGADVLDAGGDPPDAIDAASAPDAARCAAEDNRCLDEDTLQTCAGGVLASVPCADGCTGDPGDAACRGFDPSNGFDPAWLAGATAVLDIGVGQVLVLDTDTGGIVVCSGGVVRSPGPGVIAGIRFETLAGQDATAAAPSVGWRP